MEKEKENIEIKIIAANFFLAILLLLSIFIFLKYIHIGYYEKSLQALLSTIPIVAAWLVLITAKMKILQEREDENSRHKFNKVKTLHYLTINLKILKTHVNHFDFISEKEDYHLSSESIIYLYKIIETKYNEILLKDDIYQNMPGDIIDEIVGLSGYIFGMNEFVKRLTFHMDSSNRSAFEIISENKGILLSIKNTSQDIQKIIEKIYNIRILIR